MRFRRFNERKLPPEPGTVPDPDHGIPGDAEDLPENDRELGDQEAAENAEAEAEEDDED